jgi:hypothetical protein
MGTKAFCQESRHDPIRIPPVPKNLRVSETSHTLALLRRAGEQGLTNNINFAWQERA